MEIQQSRYYAEYIRSLKWIVKKVGGAYVFIKPFPIIGGIAKIQRATRLPPVSSLLPLIRTYRIRTIAVEPDCSVDQKELSRWSRTIPRYIRVNGDPFIPTKTIRVNLTSPEEEIFHRFTEAKRRAVRRAEKHGIVVSVSSDIDTFLRLKNKSAGFLGCITTTGVNKLWRILPARHKTILLARDPSGRVVGGILLLFWNAIAYYWIAAALPRGKKLFAPSLLVFKALKESKRRKCKSLDFIGVWDERRPHKNHEWKGFTKFKEGFGGTALYYPFLR